MTPAYDELISTLNEALAASSPDELIMNLHDARSLYPEAEPCSFEDCGITLPHFHYRKPE